MRLIVGLGNPGKKYANSRHNLGFRAIDQLKEKGLKDVILFTPDTFVNCSGPEILKKAKFHKIKPANILIIYDDLDLPLGEIRIRQKGSSGGHKGLASVIDALKTENFPRIRIGIGRPPKNVPAEKYVLEKFSSSEEKIIQKAIDQVIEKVIELIKTKNYFPRRYVGSATKVVNAKRQTTTYRENEVSEGTWANKGQN